MKRLLLVLVLAVSLLGLLAAPAFAHNHYLQREPGNAYVFATAFMDGSTTVTLWFEWAPVDGVYDEVFHDQTEAIPANYTVWLVNGGGSPIRGTVQNWPRIDRWAFTLAGPGGYSWAISGAASRAVWSPVFYWGMVPAFNKANTTFWARDWWLKLPNQPLASGTYTGTATERVTRIITDSSFTLDQDWARHAQQRPNKIMPGTYPWPDFSFTIAP